jgi:hypothetical protein
LKLIGSAMVRIGCQMYGHVQSPHGRAALRDYLIESGAGDAAAFRELLPSAGEHYLAEAFEILRRVRPPGVELNLGTYLGHPSPAMRRQALTIAGRGEGPRRVMQLVAALNDADAAVRAHALGVMGEAKDPALRLSLQEWIERSEFLGRDAGEKELAMKMLAKVGGPAAYVYLKEVAGRAPGMFQKAKVFETRRAAVLGLRELGTIQAYEFLAAAAGGADEQLAQFAREALAPPPKEAP